MGTTTSSPTIDENGVLTLDTYKFTNPDNTLRKLLMAPHTVILSDFDHCQSVYDVNIGGTMYQRTPIMIAARFGLIYPLEIMLQNKRIKSLISFTDKDQATALMLAAYYYNNTSSLECVKILLRHVVDLNGRELRLSEYARSTECINLLNAEIKKRTHCHND